MLLPCSRGDGVTDAPPQPSKKPKEGLPETLRALLIIVRDALARAGDDGSAGGRREMVRVPMGWAEVRAIYNLYSRLVASRDARETLKKKLAAREQDLARFRADITDHNLINDRAVLTLLAKASLIAAGTDLHEEEIRDIRAEIDAILARAKKVDRERERRARPTI